MRRLLKRAKSLLLWSLIYGSDMRFHTTQAFEKHLIEAKEHLLPLYAILTSDAFLREQLFHSFRELVKFQETKKLYSDSDKKTLLEELSAYSLLSTRRLILLENCEELKKETSLLLQTYAKNPNPTITLLLSGSALSSKPLYAIIEDEGALLVLPNEKGKRQEETLLTEINAFLKKKNVSIHQEAAKCLIQLVDRDRASLYSELQKLLTITSHITLDHVKALNRLSSGSESWHLTEALFKGDIKTALREADLKMREGETLFSLLRQIRYQFQTSFQILSMHASGLTSTDIASQLPFSPYVIEAKLSTHKKYGLKKLREGLLALDELELFLRNHSVSESLLTSYLLLRLAS